MTDLIEPIIKIIEIIIIIGFCISTAIFGKTIKTFGKSLLGSVFFYITLGTSVFIFISIFMELGPDYFGVSDASADIMWHLMFYASFFMYYLGLRSMVRMTNLDLDDNKPITISSGRNWGVVGILLIGLIFLAPKLVDNCIQWYISSPLLNFGLHHFIAFALAGTVAWYLFQAKKKFGEFGLTIANPFILAVFALSLQHFWELLSESWKIITVTGEVVESVEKVLLTITAYSLVWGAVRLNKFQEKR